MAGWSTAGSALLLVASATSSAPAQSNTRATEFSGSGEPLNRIFQEWLQAFNSGDRARIKSVYTRYTDDPDAAFALEQAEDTLV